MLISNRGNRVKWYLGETAFRDIIGSRGESEFEKKKILNEM